MKIVKKILAFPFIVILEVLAFVLTLFTILGGIVLTLVAFALCVYSGYLVFILHSVKDGVICAVVAVLCSPFGLPSIAADVINMLENASDKLKEI